MISANASSLVDAFSGICDFLADLGKDGIDLILDSVAKIEDEADVDIFLDCLKAYHETDAVILLGVCRLASMAIASGRGKIMSVLCAAVPVELMYSKRDARRIIPAAERTCGFAEEKQSGLGSRALALIAGVAGGDVSSAYIVAVRLRRILGKLPDGIMCPYLDDVYALTAAAGTRVTAFCLQELPSIYVKHGIDDATRFTGTATAIAERYGTTAAEWFLARKTKAAKSFFKKQS